jgi:hypothetical protein
MPWIASLVAHAGIVVLAAAMVVVVTSPPQILSQKQTIIPSPVYTPHNLGSVPNIAASNTTTLELTEPTPENTPPSPSVDSSGGGNSGLDLPSAVAGGGGPSGPFSWTGLGRSGEGNGRGADLGGLPGTGTGAGPRNPVFRSVGGNAKHIVFVCDASGSMTNKFATLKEQLNRAISKLRPPQTFDIIFFQNGKAICLSRDGVRQDSMILATQDMKRRASAFLEEMTIGSDSDPSEALRIGFSRKPDLLYLLTDGDFPDNDAVRAKVTALNQRRTDGSKAKVNTIAFLNDNETNPSIRATLEKIAQDQEGTFLQITESQIEAEESQR